MWEVSSKLLFLALFPLFYSCLHKAILVHRNGEDYIFVVIYVDDSIYFGSDDEIEKKFTDALSRWFKLELQGWSHYFLGTGLYLDAKGNYSLDQENGLCRSANSEGTPSKLSHQGIFWNLPVTVY